MDVPSHLLRHVAEIHIGRRYQCTFDPAQCDKDFKQKSQAVEHVKNVHMDADSLWKCFLCGDTFTRWGGVRRHLQKKRCTKMKDGDLSLIQVAEIINEAATAKCKSKCRVH